MRGRNVLLAVVGAEPLGFVEDAPPIASAASPIEVATIDRVDGPLCTVTSQSSGPMPEAYHDPDLEARAGYRKQ